MNKTLLFYTVSVIGFFFPYILKFLIASPNENIKILAIYMLGKFNLVYFAFIILFFFMGLSKKFKNIAVTAQLIFVPVYLAYVFADYFVISKMEVEKYIKNNQPDAKLVQLSELKTLPNFKIYYKKANWAAVKILPKQEKTLPFDYKKDRAQ